MTEGVLQVSDGRLAVDDEARVVRLGGRAADLRQPEADGWFTPTPR